MPWDVGSIMNTGKWNTGSHSKLQNVCFADLHKGTFKDPLRANRHHRDGSGARGTADDGRYPDAGTQQRWHVRSDHGPLRTRLQASPDAPAERRVAHHCFGHRSNILSSLRGCHHTFLCLRISQIVNCSMWCQDIYPHKNLQCCSMYSEQDGPITFSSVHKNSTPLSTTKNMAKQKWSYHSANPTLGSVEKVSHFKMSPTKTVPLLLGVEKAVSFPTEFLENYRQEVFVVSILSISVTLHVWQTAKNPPAYHKPLQTPSQKVVRVFDFGSKCMSATLLKIAACSCPRLLHCLSWNHFRQRRQMSLLVSPTKMPWTTVSFANGRKMPFLTNSLRLL